MFVLSTKLGFTVFIFGYMASDMASAKDHSAREETPCS